jgi:hypothetical protein
MRFFPHGKKKKKKRGEGRRGRLGLGSTWFDKKN